MSVKERGAAGGFADRILGWLGAYLISLTGLLHLLLAGEHLGYAMYLGLLFMLNFVLSAAAAIGIVRTGDRWAWLLGAAVAGGALVAFLYSRTVGLPGFPEGVGQWWNFLAWMSFAFELPFFAVAPLALTSRGRGLIGAEQRRIDREDLPPSRQQTPEHFRLIEGQMREIRDRMAPDIRDLRAHIYPRAIGEKATQIAKTRLRSLFWRWRR